MYYFQGTASDHDLPNWRRLIGLVTVHLLLRSKVSFFFIRLIFFLKPNSQYCSDSMRVSQGGGIDDESIDVVE